MGSLVEDDDGMVSGAGANLGEQRTGRMMRTLRDSELCRYAVSELLEGLVHCHMLEGVCRLHYLIGENVK